jgi:uncharacterized protein (DUF433 family)
VAPANRPARSEKEGAMNVSAVVAAFSAGQVAKLTGLTMRQLAYWDRIGFFRPRYASENRRSPYSRIYSFSDLVGLRTVSVLMNVYKVSLAHLREVAERLSKTTDRPWSQIKMTVWNREVSWLEPGSDVPTGAISGQRVLLKLVDVMDDMEKAAASLRKRAPEDVGRIVQHRNVAHNRAVFSGTRIPVAAVRRFAEAGYTVEQILSEYPSLTREDVRTALKEPRPRTAA